MIQHSFRRYVLYLLGLGLFVAGFTGSAVVPATAEKPPNVVLIISDDQAWTDFGFMGHEHIETPNVDRLADQSLTYTRGYVPHALCRASLATLITGLYPHQHEIVGNDPMKKDNGRSFHDKRRDLIAKIDRPPKLPSLLRAKGYLSHQSGKWWQGNYRRGGFTHGMTEGFRKNPERGRHGDKGLNIGRKGLDPVFDFIEESRDRNRPFFLWYAPFLPHTPHNPPEELLEKYRKRADTEPIARYWAMCEWFDQTVGDLLGYLDDNGLRDNTVVLFVVDNGWIQKPNSGGYAPRSKRTAYEGGVRTPIMVRWPGQVEPEMDKETVVNAVDIAPTVLEAAGMDVPPVMPGIFLLDRDRLNERNGTFGATYFHDIRDLNDPVKSLKRRWTIHEEWKLIWPYAENLPDAPVELYNLKEDPHENTNLAEQKPDLVESLKQRIENWWSIR